jgi:hypothetical protein
MLPHQNTKNTNPLPHRNKNTHLINFPITASIPVPFQGKQLSTTSSLFVPCPAE